MAWFLKQSVAFARQPQSAADIVTELPSIGSANIRSGGTPRWDRAGRRPAREIRLIALDSGKSLVEREIGHSEQRRPGGRMRLQGSPRDLCDLGANFGEDLHQPGG
jgi:hypothetical protein